MIVVEFYLLSCQNLSPLQDGWIMEYAIAKEHYDFFHKGGAVEFEGVLSPSALEEVNRQIDGLLGSAMKQPLSRCSPEELFFAGRDLWRRSSFVKKHLLHKKWARIAAELADAPLVRIGCDQLIPAGYGLELNGTLTEMFCIQGVICGALFTLIGDSREAPEAAEFTFPSPSAGNVVFFKKEHLMDFASIAKEETGRYLLVVYADAKAVYIHNDLDPLTHALKHYGYGFGDRLRDDLNPILYRRQG